MHQTQTGFREGWRRACQGFFRRHTHTHRLRGRALPHESFTHGCPKWLCLLSEHMICFGVGGYSGHLS